MAIRLFELIAKMGIRVSFDKHVSSLDELLDLSPNYFSRVRFESRIDTRISQHLKVSYLKAVARANIGVVLQRGQVETRLRQSYPAFLRQYQTDRLHVLRHERVPSSPDLKEPSM